MDEIEKLLELKPLEKAQPSKDIFPIFEEAVQDLYPQVPDPEFDYLFTNWGGKEPEKELEVSAPSNQLEKSLKRKKQFARYADLSDEQKNILNQFEKITESSRLNDKGWEKWNSADWRLAKKGLKKKAPAQLTAGGLAMLDLSHAIVGEDMVRARSQAIVEMNILDTIYKSIMTSSAPDHDKEEGKDKIYKKLEMLHGKIMGHFKIKSKEIKKYDDDGVIGIDFKIHIGKEAYVIHTHFIKSSKVFLFSLWDAEEFRVILILCAGYFKEDGYLIGTANSRLKAWMEKTHGSSKSGEDRR